MRKQYSEIGLVFRADPSLYVIPSVFTVLIVVAAFVKFDLTKPDQLLIYVALCGIMAASFLGLRYLRIEITPERFHYRNLSTKRWITFGDIEKAFFDTIVDNYAPQGVARFWVAPKQGKPMKINLRTFPIRAAATLFQALDNHGIQIEVPESWAAQRMAREIREYQAKLYLNRE